MTLSEHGSRILHEAPDTDVRLIDVRDLVKRADPLGFGGGPTPKRKRVTSNIFTTLSGRAQPRQGFLSIELMRAIYQRSELIRACIDTIIEVTAGVAWTIKPVDADRTRWLKQKHPDAYIDQQDRINWLKEFFSRPNTYQDLDTFHRVLLRDLLIYDGAGYEVVVADYENGSRLPLELGIVAGDTIEVETDEAGNPIRYWQSYNVLRNVVFEWEELAYLQMNPVSWSPYGMSPIETAYQSIMADLSAMQYNNAWFSKQGIPPALLAVIGVGQSEFRNLMSQMKSVSQDNPHNLHAMRVNRNPDGSAQKVFELVPLNQLNNREMQFHELLQLCVNRITMAYRLSPSMIGFTESVAGGIGSGVAETQEDLMRSKAIGPVLRKLAQAHTHNVIKGVCGWEDLEFSWELGDTPSEQAAYQRGLQEVQMGVRTINEMRQDFGGRKRVDWGDLPLASNPNWQPPMSPQQLQQQAMQMGMGQPGPGGQPGQAGQGGPPQLPGADQGQPEMPMGKSADKKIIIRI